MKSASPHRLLIATGVAAAVAGVGVVLVLRLRNTGSEPQGRNWWIVSQTVLGLAYLPLGAVLAARGRRRLGLAFAGVGACELLCAIAAEWNALDASPRTVPVVEHTRLLQIAGLLTLAVIVPFLLPWPRPREGDALTRWLATGVLVAWAGIAMALVKPVGNVPGGHVAGPLLLVATVPLVAVGAFVADIRGDHDALGAISHRFLVWVILASAIVLLYTALVAGFGLALGADGPAWLLIGVTGALAVAAEPARARVRHLVDDLVYGQRDDPLAVVRRLVNQQVASETDVNETMLASLTATVADALRLDHVALELSSSRPAAELIAQVGAPTDHDERFVLRIGDQLLGDLVVGCRRAPLGRHDRDALRDVVPHVALAVGLVRLTAELRRSRNNVVTAREEERRRLRRDLHDGVGPALTGISMGLHTLLRRLPPAGLDPSDTALLGRLADEVDTSAGEVKRIVRDLRPTALDDQGLAGAITEFARGLDGFVSVTLDLPRPDRTLPAAVETAAYRIALEALNNVVRHAQATTCRVCLSVGNQVELDVTDNGVGIAARHPAGVGLAAMRERAVELGGATLIEPVRPHGTRVHATLPLGMP